MRAIALSNIGPIAHINKTQSYLAIDRTGKYESSWKDRVLYLGMLHFWVFASYYQGGSISITSYSYLFGN